MTHSLFAVFNNACVRYVAPPACLRNASGTAFPPETATVCARPACGAGTPRVRDSIVRTMTGEAPSRRRLHHISRRRTIMLPKPITVYFE